MKEKIFIAFLLFVVLSISFAFAENIQQTLEPTLANAIGYTAEEWFQSEKNRALLTIILGLEYSSYDKSFDMNCLYSNASYVVYAKEYPALMVCMLADEAAYTIMYMPWLKTAVIPEQVNASSETAIELAFEFNGFEYEKNSINALSDAVGYVNGALEKIIESYQ